MIKMVGWRDDVPFKPIIFSFVSRKCSPLGRISLIVPTTPPTCFPHCPHSLKTRSLRPHIKIHVQRWRRPNFRAPPSPIGARWRCELRWSVDGIHEGTASSHLRYLRRHTLEHHLTRRTSALAVIVTASGLSMSTSACRTLAPMRAHNDHGSRRLDHSYTIWYSMLTAPPSSMYISSGLGVDLHPRLYYRDAQQLPTVLLKRPLLSLFPWRFSPSSGCNGRRPGPPGLPQFAGFVSPVIVSVALSWPQRQNQLNAITTDLI
ncbi:hypothetical protein A0H81_13736 [Grifola frondosa]|uniref:Uncharacterized protein n=1 Tax=Grifola frondosa TaxID=5627 RepID=A0A1C7LNJ5_GRIFR|nr:hypothetical protein A0H81_13736 [Grifola frondosa]